MPFNKGDFTQQGVDGYVEGGLLLNQKRNLTTKISTDEDSAGLEFVGINIHDHLNDLDYTFIGQNVSAGSSVIGQAPSGNIAITENTAEGETLDVSQYATATVNVPTGIDFIIPSQLVNTPASGTVTIQNSFPTAVESLPDYIVLRLTTTAYGYPFHAPLIAHKQATPEYTVSDYGDIGGTTMKLTVFITRLDAEGHWGFKVLVNDVQTAFTDVLISAIPQWQSETPPM